MASIQYIREKWAADAAQADGEVDELYGWYDAVAEKRAVNQARFSLSTRLDEEISDVYARLAVFRSMEQTSSVQDEIASLAQRLLSLQNRAAQDLSESLEQSRRVSSATVASLRARFDALMTSSDEIPATSDSTENTPNS
jgi:hypothetical protein